MLPIFSIFLLTSVFALQDLDRRAPLYEILPNQEFQVGTAFGLAHFAFNLYFDHPVWDEPRLSPLSWTDRFELKDSAMVIGDQVVALNCARIFGQHRPGDRYVISVAAYPEAEACQDNSQFHLMSSAHSLYFTLNSDRPGEPLGLRYRFHYNDFYAVPLSP